MNSLSLKYPAFILSALLASAPLAAPALAQTTLQPGLWEYTFDIKSQSGQIEAALAQAKKMLQAMPPEQRAMIEKQLAIKGISMDLDSYKGQVCVSADQAKSGLFPQPNDDCQQKVVERRASLYKVQFSCEGEPPTTGEGEIRMLSDKQYQGSITINTSINEQSETLSATQSGKWLAADCGAVEALPNLHCLSLRWPETCATKAASPQQRRRT